MNYTNNIKHELSSTKAYEHNLPDKRTAVDMLLCNLAATFGVFVDRCVLNW